MPLIKCSECGRDISDKAAACPGCGAPLAGVARAVDESPGPTSVRYDKQSDTFAGTMPLMVKLAMRAVQQLGWKLDQANEGLGLITFETGMSWGSWSGVAVSLNVEEVSPHVFRVGGTGKQNVRGGQLFAMDIGGESRSKARKAIEKMKELAV
jgi:hypothetical protein